MVHYFGHLLRVGRNPIIRILMWKFLSLKLFHLRLANDCFCELVVSSSD